MIDTKEKWQEINQTVSDTMYSIVNTCIHTHMHTINIKVKTERNVVVNRNTLE
jgi:hypothetical protein